MRHILRSLGVRYGTALGLLLLVAAVVLIGKAVGGSANAQLPTDVPVSTPFSASPGEEDDGVPVLEPPPGPSTSPGALPPQTVAVRFTAAWVKHTNINADAWYAGLRKYLTQKLAGELKDVDPAAVPASQITGSATVIPHSANFVEVTVPLDTGAVRLRLLGQDGRWLVDGVDWSAS